MDILIFEGEREMCSDNNFIGKFSLENIPPMLRGVPQIEVTFEINTNGILEVSAVETSTGVENSIVIKNDRNNVLSEEDIARMVEEAEKFKEHDRVMREIADARNVLNDYAYKMAHIVRDETLASKLDEDMQEEIADIVADVIDWLDENVQASRENLEKRLEILKKDMKKYVEIVFPGGVPENFIKPTHHKQRRRVVDEVDGGNSGMVRWQRGAKRCIVEDIDD